jgi:hypothetical protein
VTYLFVVVRNLVRTLHFESKMETTILNYLAKKYAFSLDPRLDETRASKDQQPNKTANKQKEEAGKGKQTAETCKVKGKKSGKVARKKHGENKKNRDKRKKKRNPTYPRQ